MVYDIEAEVIIGLLGLNIVYCNVFVLTFHRLVLHSSSVRLNLVETRIHL